MPPPCSPRFGSGRTNSDESRAMPEGLVHGRSPRAVRLRHDHRRQRFGVQTGRGKQRANGRPEACDAGARHHATSGGGRGQFAGRGHAASAERPVGTHPARLCHAESGHRTGSRPRTVVRHPARLHAAHDRALPQIPVLHRGGVGAAQHAHRDRAAALHRERLQSPGHIQRQGGRHVAVHARHRKILRTQAERVPR